MVKRGVNIDIQYNNASVGIAKEDVTCEKDLRNGNAINDMRRHDQKPRSDSNDI